MAGTRLTRLVTLLYRTYEQIHSAQSRNCQELVIADQRESREGGKP